ncbi:MAG TPA: hypothetical protein VJZ72_07245 [Candidatus Limnocylindrales bacterium]|nr:hypothetical protein [Candidatus Limnocylindrales bacterium]
MEIQPEDSATVTPPTPTSPTPAVPAADPTTPAPDPTPTPAAAPVRSAPTPSPHPRVGAPLLNIVLVIAGAFAIAGIAFAIGRGTAPSALDQLRVDGPGGRDGQFFIGPGGQGGQGFPGQGGGRVPLLGTGGGIAIEGTVESIDGDSMTIKTTDGQSIELSLDGETSYHTASDASASAVTNGSKVVVRVQPGRGQQGPGSGGGFDLGADDVTVVP